MIRLATILLILVGPAFAADPPKQNPPAIKPDVQISTPLAEGNATGTLILHAAVGQTPALLLVISDGGLAGAYQLTPWTPGPGPNPPPPPPPPTPVVKRLLGVAIYENDSLPLKKKWVAISPAMRTALDGLWYPTDRNIVDPKNAVPDAWKSWLERARTGNNSDKDYMALSDADTNVVVWEGPIPEGLENALSLVAKFKPPKDAKELPVAPMESPKEGKP